VFGILSLVMEEKLYESVEMQVLRFFDYLWRSKNLEKGQKLILKALRTLVPFYRSRVSLFVEEQDEEEQLVVSNSLLEALFFVERFV
jgi:hypothetical protein